MKKLLLILSTVLILPFYGMSQNVSVSDDTLYNPESSAMLDVHSESKGFLVPRLTQAQITGISEPATGLLVFNTDENKFNYYTGSGWIVLNAGNPDGLWATKEDTLVYLNDSLAHFGIGTYTPSGKLEVRADQSIGDDDPLFEVKNHAGEPVFAVYPNGVRVFTNENSKGDIGGFAVSGRSATKAVSDYFQVTPDSVRVYIKESGKGNIGGFAVSGRSATKSTFDNYLEVTPSRTQILFDTTLTKGNIGGFAVSGRSATKNTIDNVFVSNYDSTRVYINENGAKGNIGGFAVSGRSAAKSELNDFLQVTPAKTHVFVDKTAKGNIGGFAVSGRNAAKGVAKDAKGNIGGFAVSGRNATKAGYVLEDILVTTPDSTRIYVDSNSTKGNIGGFAVSGRSAAKGSLNNFMDMTQDNYFIGHKAGSNTTTGQFNSFVGFENGLNNTTGSNNVTLGYQAGMNNQDGNRNVFIGDKAGKLGSHIEANVFVGASAGMESVTAYNTFVGYEAGYHDVNGAQSVYVGIEAGRYAEGGFGNIFMGRRAGHNAAGNHNVYIGYDAGAWPNQTNESQYNNGDENVYIGYQSGANSLTSDNTFLGAYSGNKNGTGSKSVCIGKDAGRYNTSSSQNTIVGYQAGYNESETAGIYGAFNTFMGAGAAHNISSNIKRNVIIGYNSGTEANNDENVFIGAQAGEIETGADNVYIGAYAGCNNAGGSNNVFIGKSAGVFENSVSNKLYIESRGTSAGAALIYGDFYTNELRFNANVGILAPPNSTHELYVNGDIYATGTISGGSSGDSDWTISGNDIYAANSGNVGIGTSSPSDKLDVNGGVILRGVGDAPNGTAYSSPYESLRMTGSTSDYIISTQDGSGRIQHYWNSTTGGGTNQYLVSSEPAWMWDVSLTSDPYMEFKYAASGTAGNSITWDTHMAFLSNGNVGIGYTNPSYKLDINGHTRVDGRFYITSGETWKKLDFAYESGGYSYMTIYDGSSNDDIQLATGSNSWFAGSGDFGIGTKSPSEKLHVAGNAYITDDLMIGGKTTDIISLNGNDMYVAGDFEQNGSGGASFYNIATGSYDPSGLGVGDIAVNGHLAVGTDNPNSGFHVNTSESHKVEKKTSKAGIPLGKDDHIVYSDVSLGYILPDAASCIGREYVVKNTGVSPVSLEVDGSSGDLIEGKDEIKLSQQWDYIRVIAAENNLWLMVGGNVKIH